jgi:AAA+ superfamily predicted ATPase
MVICKRLLISDVLDDAFVRRMDFFVYVDIPSQKELVLLMKKQIEKIPCDVTESEWVKIAKKMKGTAHSYAKTLMSNAYTLAQDKLLDENEFKRSKKALGVTPANKKTRQTYPLKLTQIPITMFIEPKITYSDIIGQITDSGGILKGQYEPKRFRDWKNKLGGASHICKFFPE